jgi:hypothetical protein
METVVSDIPDVAKPDARKMEIAGIGPPVKYLGY